MRNLAKLTIQVTEDDPADWHADRDHVTIEVTADEVARLLDGAEKYWPDDQAAAAALRDSAGTLARLGLWASAWLVVEQLNHGCIPAYRGSASPLTDAPFLGAFCHVECSIEVLQPNSDWGYSPFISINVPRERKAHWLDRVQVWLAMIASEARPPQTDVGSPPTDIRMYSRRQA